MPYYRFAIHGDKAPEPVTASLPDDSCAWDYAESTVRSLLSEDTPGSDAWTMSVTEGAREVASIAFDLKALRDLRSIQ
jgi:hypothetical protein